MTELQEALQAKLLKRGGLEVVFPQHDHDLGRLIGYGKFMLDPWEQTDYRPKIEFRCDNIWENLRSSNDSGPWTKAAITWAELTNNLAYMKDPITAEFPIVTGYARTIDLWHPHVWLIKIIHFSDAPPMIETIIEIDGKVDDYYGLILNGRQCLQFWAGNWLSKKYPMIMRMLGIQTQATEVETNSPNHGEHVFVP